MPMFSKIWNDDHNADILKVVAVALGVAGAAYFTWRLTRLAFQTLLPAFIPGERNAARVATAVTGHEDTLEGVEEYDVVIVGGGTAGCVLAGRLSEDPNLRVLLIEAGKSDLGVLASRLPALCAKFPGSSLDYDLETEPESNMHNRRMKWPRGRILGGCSSVNACMYIHCPAADYDEWATKYNATGWAWKDLQPFFRKAEMFTPNALWPVDDSIRGKEGPWQTTYPKFLSPLADGFFRACSNLGYPTIPDINHGHERMLGATRIPVIIDQNGRRSSAATAYLPTEVCRRKNLKICVGMTVTRILSSVGSDGVPVAQGVELASGAHTQIRFRVKARRDVIVACGSVHTPHILKLSGFGPREELAQHDIKVVKDLPGVGSNLQDHLVVQLSANTTKGTGLNYINKPLSAVKIVLRWLFFGTGIFGSNLVEGGVWMRSCDDPSMVDKVEDLASSPQEPDFEILSVPAFTKNMGKAEVDTNADQWTLVQVSLRPSSVGSITLANSNPFIPPVIRANYFSTEHDRRVAIWGFKKSCEIIRASGVFESWNSPPRADELTDEEILDFLKEDGDTLFHPVGTAKIGLESDRGVVDSNLAVHGVRNLRVCDASVFPRIVAGHPCAPVVGVAEKFADMLKKEYRIIK